GRPHTLTASLGAAGAVYPLKLTGISVDYTMPAKAPRGPATFSVEGVSGVAGAVLGGWPATATSTELAGVRQVNGTVGPAAQPAVTSAPAAAGGAATTTFTPGHGLAWSALAGVPPSPMFGQPKLPATRPPGAITGIATSRFLATNHVSAGSTVQTIVDGAVISVKIVAAMSSFPTVSASAGALVVDLGSLQEVLNGTGLAPAQASQWWLATSSGVPPGLAGVLPPGSAHSSPRR